MGYGIFVHRSFLAISILYRSGADVFTAHEGSCVLHWGMHIGSTSAFSGGFHNTRNRLSVMQTDSNVTDD